jgi:hypothetical protein
LEAMSASLSKELDPSWNIRVKVLVIGGFNTGVLDKIEMLPVSAAYKALPETAPIKATRAFWKTETPKGDPAKAARAIFELSRDNELEPLRVPLGPEVVQGMEESIEERKLVLEKAGKYSDDLQFTN